MYIKFVVNRSMQKSYKCLHPSIFCASTTSTTTSITTTIIIIISSSTTTTTTVLRFTITFFLSPR